MLVVVDYAVREVDQELGEASLSGRIVAKHRGEGGVAKWLWETLAESLAGASIVAQSSGD